MARQSQHPPAASARASKSASAGAVVSRMPSAPTALTATNPIATAYFRAAEEEEGPTAEGTPPGAPEHASHGDMADVSVPRDDISASIDAVIELLAEAGVTSERPRALLEAADGGARAVRLPLLRRLMEFLLHRDQTAYLTRRRELAFLANTLQAGCSVQSRPFTPEEASDAAACVCNLGLESLGTVLPDTFLVEQDLVAVFESGWSVLHRDVSLFVADQLMTTVGD